MQYGVLLIVVLYVVGVRADDVASLRADIEQLKVTREQNKQLAQELAQLRNELSELRERSRQEKNAEMRTSWLESSVSEARGQVSELGAALEALTSQLSGLKTEVKANAAAITSLQKMATSRKKSYEHRELPPVKREVESRHRHGRGQLRAEVAALAEWEAKTEDEVSNLNSRLDMLETNSSLEKIHGSVLELLESLEALESRVDTSLPAMRKEISRSELDLARVAQDVALLKEEQKSQKMTVQALSSSMSSMQEKVSSVKMMKFKHQKVKSGDNPTEVVSKLNAIISEYEDNLQALSHDCRGSDGLSLQMISLGGRPRLVACESGWTVVQRRKDGSVQFNRLWEEYAIGFGTPKSEFWIGNEALHLLTVANRSRLRVEMVDIYGKHWLAEYSQFRVGSREEGFPLTVSGFSGNASDALAYQNGMQFSAKDSDRDVSNTHCAENYEGGWWFSHCQHANLNGRYNLGLTWFHAAKNEWIAVAESVMKVKTE
ncbi:protein scabrous [Halyomorpha halys]|uniref:protein scabrous n=1 Tax=Halyomorpha halys TaxID=286706 RepID=UPI0006D4C9F1